jgi:hypothetical protein
MLVGPRINTYFKAPSCDLFLTCRAEKFIEYYTVLYNTWQVICGLPNVEKPVLWIVAFAARVGTFLTPVLCFWSNCPTSSKPLPQLSQSGNDGHGLAGRASDPLILPLNPTFICDTISNLAEYDIGTLDIILVNILTFCSLLQDHVSEQSNPSPYCRSCPCPV